MPKLIGIDKLADLKRCSGSWPGFAVTGKIRACRSDSKNDDGHQTNLLSTTGVFPCSDAMGLSGINIKPCGSSARRAEEAGSAGGAGGLS